MKIMILFKKVYFLQPPVLVDNTDKDLIQRLLGSCSISELTSRRCIRGKLVVKMICSMLFSL
jgi:hypothetical protein